MNELTLEWQEGRQKRMANIRDGQPSKNPGTVRIGRDPVKCDLVISDLTVSGLHVEILFDSSTYTFVLRNLRDTNPPTVDGRQVIHGEIPLTQGSTIYLGQVYLTVLAVSLEPPINPIQQTIILPVKQTNPPIARQTNPPIATSTNPPIPNLASYGLECP
ncbi:MAG TPA: peptide-binding protein, partial [Cyanobacteria bacterium UBA11367]|nr:peptide-binding protein [Cyanobacteria bacterium UBA11367]